MTAVATILLALALSSAALAAAPATAPPPGLREPSLNVYAIVGASVVVSPDKTIDNATLVVRDGVIVAVGQQVEPPADARRVDATGKTIYPGLLDAFAELSADVSRSGVKRDGGAGYWNSNVIPQVNTGLLYAADASANKKLRSQGITARLIAPSVGIVKGTSALVSTGDGDGKQVILKNPVALHLKLTTSRGSSGYPNSPMGALTLVRQAFYDAGWYGQAWEAFEQNSELTRPERSNALAVLRHISGPRTAGGDRRDRRTVLLAPTAWARNSISTSSSRDPATNTAGSRKSRRPAAR